MKRCSSLSVGACHRAAPGVPAATHSTYRTRPGADLAIMTFSNFVPAPAGHVYQAWARQDDAWRSLGIVPLDANGHALVIVDQPGEQLPRALQVSVRCSRVDGQHSSSPADQRGVLTRSVVPFTATIAR